MLGNPVPIPVLELLDDRPTPVRDLLADIDIEHPACPQQVAVLRRAGIVTSTRGEGGTKDLRPGRARRRRSDTRRPQLPDPVPTGQAELHDEPHEDPADADPYLARLSA